MKIPILDLSQEIEAHWVEFNDAFQRILKSGQFIGGPEVEGFESEMAAYLGTEHVIGVNSGTDALVISLKACGVKSGDEVICPSFTFFATAEAISQVGATPVFVDIHPTSLNIDPLQIEKKISSKTKAILPVHLFGYPADIARIRTMAEKHDLLVLEDAAQACGTECQGHKAGTLGHAGAFSFFPTKNLAAFGDGGMIVTADDQTAELCRKLRTHGSVRRYHNEMLGYNSRLDAIQAAMLRIKLGYLDESNECRRQAANRYNELLSKDSQIVLPAEPPRNIGTHIFHQYTIRITNGRRDEAHKKLAEQGIQTMVYYPIPVHRLGAYASNQVLPNTDSACQEACRYPSGPASSQKPRLKSPRSSGRQ